MWLIGLLCILIGIYLVRFFSKEEKYEIKEN